MSYFSQSAITSQADSPLFKAIFNQTAVGLASVNSEGRWLQVNQKLAEMLGYSCEELLTYSLSEITWSEDRFTDEDLIQKLNTGPLSSYTVEKRLLHQAGYQIWVNLTFARIQSSPDSPLTFLVVVEEISDRKQLEDIIKALVRGTAQVNGGADFFPLFTQYLAFALNIRHAMVTELIEDSEGRRLHSLGFWAGDKFIEDYTYGLENTPCERVINEGISCFREQLQTLFPLDLDLVGLAAESYLGIPLFATSGKVIGHLCILDDKPLLQEQRARSVLAIFAARAASELERRLAEQALLKTNQELEIRVQERTAELATANQDLAKTLQELKAAQEELIHSEKMAALGQLVAGIAHEVNTPLGAIRSSAGNLIKFLNQILEKLPTLFQTLSPEEGQLFLNLVQRSLQQDAMFSTKEERQFRRTLRRELENLNINGADLVADRLVLMGLPHEIEGILPLLKRQDYLQILEIAYQLSELKRGMTTISTATERASKVVFALKTYARHNPSGEMIPASIAEGIETILTLYQNQLKHGVEIIRNYQELPSILCYPDELNQVWTNLIHNAVQAMDYHGTLKIEVSQIVQQVQVRIIDSGHGIPDEVKPKIFEPFFTTKAPGEGSGLGLDIVRKIVEKHSGKIEVESRPGQTTFTVLLPIHPL